MSTLGPYSSRAKSSYSFLLSEGIYEVCTQTDEARFNEKFLQFKKLISSNPMQLDKIRNNGWTYLNDIIWICAKKNSNKKLAAKIAAKMLEVCLLELDKLPKHPEAVIRARMNDSKRILQQVVMNDFPEAVKYLANYFVTKGRETLLAEQLENVNNIGIITFQTAIHSRSITNIDSLLGILSRKECRQSLVKTLSHRSTEGYMLLHETVKTGSAPIMGRIVKILEEKENTDLLIMNLANRTRKGTSIFEDVLRIGPEENVRTIIELSEKYLPLDRWQRRLTEENKHHYNHLHSAVNYGTSNAVTCLVDAIVRAYKDEAPHVLARLMQDRRKFRHTQRYEELVHYVKHYPFDAVLVASHKSTTQEMAARLPSEEALAEKLLKATQLNSPSIHVSSSRAFDGSHLHQDKSLPIVHSENGLATITHSRKLNDLDMELEDSDLNSSSESSDNALEPSSHSDADSLSESHDESESSSLDEDSSSELLSIPSPCGGIDAKYLGGALPQLPEPAFEHEGTITTQQSHYHHEYTLQELNTHTISKNAPPKRVISIKHPHFEADYVTSKQRPVSDDKLTFVLAGRKQEAYVPSPLNGRCVLVMTQGEYHLLKESIPAQYDVLVLKSIKSSSHGAYTQLGLPTTRRLGIFLLATAFKLNTFLMIDDNLKKVKTNTRNGGWDSVYQLIENNMDDLLCATVRTESHKEPRPGELGSKMYMINMKEIVKKLPTIKDIFTLFPKAENAHYWGEDYYFQLVLHAMTKHKSTGYAILDKDLICLVRSEKNRNLFAKTGAEAIEFDEIDETVLQQLSPYQRGLIEESIETLNSIIRDNINRYERNKKRIERANLHEKHAKANLSEPHQPPEPVVSDESEAVDSDTTFIERFQNKIKQSHFEEGIFRPYQIEAIQAIGNLTTKRSRLLLATGSGKTYLQCELMRMAYHCAKKGEHIIVVTPHIKLVDQFYEDFLEFNKNVTTIGQDYRVPAKSIIKVCSQKQSCHVKALLMNDKIQSQTSILIFCSDSLETFLAENDYKIPQVPLILLDEYHYYTPTVKTIVENLQNCSPLILGSTATPPSPDPIRHTSYYYSRMQGVKDRFLAPVISDSLGVDYSRKSVNALIHCLPLMLTQPHPGYKDKKVLKEAKGAVFLPSIADCEQAAQILKAKGIRCYCIHSQNPHHEDEVAKFLESEEPAVVLAVRMLRVGFNAKDLAWVIIGQNAKASDPASRSNIEQIIGRVMRAEGDKIGYVLAFDDVRANVLSPMLASQPVTFPVNPEYLATENVYYCQRRKKQWNVCDSMDPIILSKIKVPYSDYDIGFTIQPRTITKFDVTPLSLQDKPALTPQTQEEAFRILAFGYKSEALFSAFGKSKRRKGKLAHIISESTQSIVDFVNEPARNEDNVSIRKV